MTLYNARQQPSVQVFIAACSGSARLAEDIGVPLVHVDVSLDPEASIARLNARAYGSGVRVANMFQPILFEGGWADWKLFDYSGGHWPTQPRWLDGIQAIDGRIFVSVPGTCPSEFREQLRAALRHRRLQEVTSRMAYMEARSAVLADYVVHPRYTPNPIGGFHGATIVTDLYVIDPAEDPWSLFWAVVSARFAAIEETSS